MRGEYHQKFNPELVEMNEKLRKDAMRTLEQYGQKQISDLPEMSEGERSKWFFWNMHENLEEFRRLEPTLIGQVMSTQMVITEGQQTESGRNAVEKKVVLQCRWHLRVAYAGIQNEETYQIGDGKAELTVCDGGPPPNASLQDNQRGYLHSDSSLYPNQLFLGGWISEGLWNEVRQHLYSGLPNCHTDILLKDNYLFPVRAGFDFVVGPPASIGITNMDFCVSSSSGERRNSRRSESLPR
ncbi:hypothetical protein SAMN06265795_115120 [Noviherbaspirillum humi]|uniref:Uncharacterized protein n=1 Tax=Noviherbaspirillum humi TaxID=1688639 RepID=A0A239KES2_9BURK|nr:hypothetical protein [Noviherbaspirillum humi]SNT16202.1 hypothetical protein SAMN06265795_115120 [Noviherbaspirillum humi]